MSSAFIPESERAFVRTVSQLLRSNPFLPERIALEKEALGSDYQDMEQPWNVSHMEPTDDPNMTRLCERAFEVTEACRKNLETADTDKISPEEAMDYFNVVLMILYYIYFREPLGAVILDAHEKGHSGEIRFYSDYLKKLTHYIGPIWDKLGPAYTPEHIFAYGFQSRRAYFYIFRFVVGRSPAVTRLRARIWQSIFTHSMERYRSALYMRMNNIFTLITGPSGSGKELVARAIAMTRYIPYDAKKERFVEDFITGFYPLNLSAISPTLIESELFGHRKGAFTGALTDRKGYLEECGPWGSVFLDEIGDVSPEIQVKLLRVLQTRTFQRLGDTKAQAFQGKIISATNKDLVEEIRAGRFRSDLFYRLCADQVITPSLKEILADEPSELQFLVSHIAQHVTGPEEAGSLTAEVCAWIHAHLGDTYTWTGNFRELEQCVKNILVHQAYIPQQLQADSFLEQVKNGDYTVEDLLSGYITRVYAKHANYEKTARTLDIDSRTVKKYLNRDLLDE